MIETKSLISLLRLMELTSISSGIMIFRESWLDVLDLGEIENQESDDTVLVPFLGHSPSGKSLNLLGMVPWFIICNLGRHLNRVRKLAKNTDV